MNEPCSAPMTVSVVIPVYNEAATLPTLLAKVLSRFVFNDAAPAEISSLALRGALPICLGGEWRPARGHRLRPRRIHHGRR